MKKTVFIIGASSGIGYECAKKFLENDYEVYNGSRTKCDIENVLNLMVDVLEIDQLKEAVNTIMTETGRIDTFIYSAGFSMAAPFEYTTESDYRYLFEVNFFGFVKALQLIIPIMRNQNEGRIIGVSSIGGILPIAFDPFYSASKSALNMLIKELAIELNEFNIKITSIMPGGTVTNFTSKRKIYSDENTHPYSERLIRATASLAETEQGGMSPEKVADCIFDIAYCDNPPLTKAVGFVNNTYAIANKILPEKVVSYFNKTKYHQTQK